MNVVKKSAEKSEIKIILSKQWHLLSIKREANFLCSHSYNSYAKGGDMSFLLVVTLRIVNKLVISAISVFILYTQLFIYN